MDAVSFRYDDMEMRFDLTIEPGEFVVVLGASGAGKSTLLNLIAGFDRPGGGRIMLMGQSAVDLPPAERPVTTLFQEGNLFPHLTVAQNVGLGLHPGLKLDTDQKKSVDRALGQMGLSNVGKRLPKALSGGERQRVALARSLVRNRPILLLDEPFAALDPGRRQEMIDLVRDLAAERGLTVVMVSHQIEEVRELPVRAIFVHNGQIITDGVLSELLDKPDHHALQTYLGR